MLKNQITQQRKKNLKHHGLIILTIVIIYLLALIVIPEMKEWIHLLGLSLLFMSLISLLFGTYRIKHALLNKTIKINEVHELVPYPQKFRDTLVQIGDLFKNYRYKKYIIPEYLIEFREGNTLYLYQMIQKPTDENFTIVKINKFDIALVLDHKHKKRIVHLGNAELVE